MCHVHDSACAHARCREKTKALKEQEQKAAEMQRLAEEREADAKFDAAAGF